MSILASKRPPPPNPELNEPWRKFDWGEKRHLKEKLENFSLSHPDVRDIKILLAGEIAAGKSSFINSVDSALQGRISSRALVDSAASNSFCFTQKLQEFSIRSGEKRLPFIVKDTMGLEANAFEGSQVEDIISALFGRMKDGYKFNSHQPLTSKDQDYNTDPSISDQCFCLVYVIDANAIQSTDEKLINKLKLIRQRISDKGIPQVVVMTKVDETCPLTRRNLRKVYTSKKIKEKMELCSCKVGVPLTNIFPVKNYHDEINTDDDIDVLILKALEQIVHLANDRLEDTDI